MWLPENRLAASLTNAGQADGHVYLSRWWSQLLKYEPVTEFWMCPQEPERARLRRLPFGEDVRSTGERYLQGKIAGQSALDDAAFARS